MFWSWGRVLGLWLKFNQNQGVVCCVCVLVVKKKYIVKEHVSLKQGWVCLTTLLRCITTRTPVQRNLSSWQSMPTLRR